MSDGDSSGTAFVYALKAQIASSPLYTLADSLTSAAFDVEVVTVGMNDDTGTAGAIVIECGAGSSVGCAAGQVVDIFAFLAGSDRTDDEAKRMMASIDHSISGLPVKGQ